jgi:hypothetical protein
MVGVSLLYATGLFQDPCLFIFVLHCLHELLLEPESSVLSVGVSSSKHWVCMLCVLRLVPLSPFPQWLLKNISKNHRANFSMETDAPLVLGQPTLSLLNHPSPSSSGSVLCG